MKRIGLTLLTAFVGGAMALGTYKIIEKKYADNMSFDDKQDVYFASNHLAPNITSSAGEVDFTQAAAAVTPAVVYIKTTYSSTEQNSQQDRMQQLPPDQHAYHPERHHDERRLEQPQKPERQHQIRRRSKAHSQREQPVLKP